MNSFAPASESAVIPAGGTGRVGATVEVAAAELVLLDVRVDVGGPDVGTDVGGPEDATDDVVAVVGGGVGNVVDGDSSPPPPHPAATNPAARTSTTTPRIRAA